MNNPHKFSESNLSISDIKTIQEYLKQAESYKEQGDWELAIACYRQVIDLNPRSVTAYHNWGDALLNLARWEEAVEIYHRCLEVNPNFDWSYYNLGEALIKLERWEEAIIVYQRGLDLNPSLPEIYKKLANAFYQRAISDREELLKQYRLAIQEYPQEIQNYHQAIELQSQNAELYFGLGQALVSHQKLDEAIIAYQMALQLEPNYEAAQQALNRIVPFQEPSAINVTEINNSPEFKLRQAKQLLDNLNRLTLETFLQSEARLIFPKLEQPKISIILILYNRAELTLSCLYSLLHNHYQNFEVVIVDNNSTDLTGQLLDNITNAKIIRNEENKHFLLAVNQASNVATGTYLLLLNNDAQVLGNSIDLAIQTIESDPDIGAVGGKIILPDGSLQEAGSIIWQDGSCLGYGRGDSPQAPPYMFQRNVDYCSGAFLLTPRELFDRLGKFDLVYQPAYYEETDYCVRLHKADKKIVYDPNVVILHYEFASSSSSDRAIELQQRNQQIFNERHRDWLSSQLAPDLNNILLARCSRNNVKRILFLDDRIPHPYLGSGYTRSHRILHNMVYLGYFVTFYPTDLSYAEAWQEVYRDIDRTVEVMPGFGLDGLRDFLKSRQGYYDCIFVSRPHNMNHVNYLLSKENLLSGVKIVYDAEALYSLRDFAYQELIGQPVSPEERQQKITTELELAQHSHSIISVSPAEQQQFVDYGYQQVEVLGHALEINPTSNSFDNRHHLLFVGSVYELASPNADSILWLGKEIFPRIQEKLGTDIKLLIAGINTVEELTAQVEALNNPAISLLGKVEDLTSLYNLARLFVAPTRFAAGIAHKVHEAASRGLPVVTTSLIANQLGWTNEVDLLTADDADSFAESCVRLYRDRQLWENLRQNAIKQIEKQCSPLAFTHTLKLILEQ
jgi:GT2 family glycosyltransferase/Tfp pilus assembly protein PilF